MVKWTPDTAVGDPLPLTQKAAVVGGTVPQTRRNVEGRECPGSDALPQLYNSYPSGEGVQRLKGFGYAGRLGKTVEIRKRIELPIDAVLLYTDGPKLDSQYCSSDWVVYRQGTECLAGQCNVRENAEVSDGELHAIQEGLLDVRARGWQPSGMLALVHADN